jgi:hypothetical protein
LTDKHNISISGEGLSTEEAETLMKAYFSIIGTKGKLSSRESVTHE